MNITLYKCTCEMDNATKSSYLTSPLSIDGTLRDESNVLNPSITFKATFNPQDYNYAYIKEFNRYYFITNITYVRNDVVRVDFNVDILYTYWEKATINGIVERNQYNYNDLVNDSAVTVSQDIEYTILHEAEVILQSSVGNKGNVVLTIVNGVNNE